jgi:hypothetical protein
VSQKKDFVDVFVSGIIDGNAIVNLVAAILRKKHFEEPAIKQCQHGAAEMKGDDNPDTMWTRYQNDR